MGSNREKSNIAIAILEKLSYLKGNKNISHFDDSNNILADCIPSNKYSCIFSDWEKERQPNVQ